MSSYLSRKRLQQEINALPKFTKRQRLRYSLVTREQFQEVMDFLKRHIKEAQAGLQQAAQHIGISYPLIIKWRNRLKIDSAYNPKADYEKLHRAMSPRLEEQIIMEIETNFIEKGYYFNNQLLKLIAQTAWQNAPAEDRLRKTFKASNRWCKDFRLRHGYVWRKAHLKRRPVPNEVSEAYRKKFKSDIETLVQDLKAQGLLFTLCNMDETAWKLAYFGQLTWAKKGAREVRITANYNIKDSFTCLATITADPSSISKLPLFLVAKGKQERCHKQFNNIKEVFPGTEIYHSESGWSNVDVMAKYLEWLRYIYDITFASQENYVPGTTPIHLIIDCYASHRNEKAKEIARAHNIFLQYIPAGATDEYQPLDIRVFGALKAMARKSWYQVLYDNPEIVPTRSKAAFIMAQCWNSLSDEVIESAWALYKTAIYQEEQEERVTDIYEHTMNAEEFHQTIADTISNNRDLPGNYGTDIDMHSEVPDNEEDEDDNGDEESNENEEEDICEGEDYEGWENESDDFLENLKHDFSSYFTENPQNPDDEQAELREEESEYDECTEETCDDIVPQNCEDNEEISSPQKSDEETAQEKCQEIINTDSFLAQDNIIKEQRATNCGISTDEVEYAYGIQNIGESCYFNAFLQLLLAIPNPQEIMISKDSLETQFEQDLYDFIEEMYNLLQSNASVITRAEILNALSHYESNLQEAVNVSGGNCPETFIRGFFRRDMIEIVYINPDISILEQVPVTRKRVLILIRTKGIRYKKVNFPMTISKFGMHMGLKLVITHPFNHFITFLRDGIENHFYRINDSSVTPKSSVPETLTNIGLYLSL